MISITKDSVGTEGMKQVARLLQQLGLPENLKIEYGKKEHSNPIVREDLTSSVGINNVSVTFNNFGYEKLIYDESYSTSNVVEEIGDGYPLLLYGRSDKFVHCWLAHGLLKRKSVTIQHNINGDTRELFPKNEWYILCSPGWRGENDGYYLSGVFDLVKTETGGGPKIPEDKFATRNTYNDYYFRYNLRVIRGIGK